MKVEPEFVIYRGVRMSKSWPDRIREAQSQTHYDIAGKTVERIRFGQEDYFRPEFEVCADCRVEPGEYHVIGCDAEECPICRGQVITCDCPFDEGL